MELNIQEKKMPLGERVKNFFKNPRALFEEKKIRPAFIVPLIIIIAIAVIFALIETNYTKDLLNSAVQKKQASMPAEQAQIFESMMEVINSPAVKAVSAVFSVLITTFLAALLYFAFMKLLKGDGTYIDAVVVYCISHLAVSIGQIFKSIYMLISGKPIGANIDGSLVNVLIGNFDIFLIWKMVLMVIGFSVAFNIPKKKSIIPVITFWILGFFIALLSTAV